MPSCAMYVCMYVCCRALSRRCLLFDVVVRCLGWRFDVSPFGTPDDGRSGRLAVPVKSSESVDTCATESLVPVSPEVYGELLHFFGLAVYCCGTRNARKLIG